MSKVRQLLDQRRAQDTMPAQPRQQLTLPRAPQSGSTVLRLLDERRAAQPPVQSPTQVNVQTIPPPPGGVPLRAPAPPAISAPLRAVGRSAVNLGAGAVESVGAGAALGVQAAGGVASGARALAEGLAPDVLTTQSPESLLNAQRNAIVRQMLGGVPEETPAEAFLRRRQEEKEQTGEAASIAASPFERIADRIRTVNETPTLRRVFNVDPDTPLKEKLKDPKWWSEDFVEGASSAVAFLLPGVSVSRGVRLAGAGQATAAKVGATVSGALVGATEAGLGFDEMKDGLIEQGYSDSEATIIASRGGVAYGIASGIIERGVFPAQMAGAGTATRGLRGWITRQLMGGFGEMTEEEAQALTMGLTRAAVGLNPDITMEGLAETAIMSFIPGAGMRSLSRAQTQSETEQSTEAPETAAEPSVAETMEQAATPTETPQIEAGAVTAPQEPVQTPTTETADVVQEAETTQAEEVVEPAVSDKQPWEMTEEERKGEIRRLQREHKQALATPLASEGGVSPVQVGRMSKREQNEFLRLGQERMLVEEQIRDLRNPSAAKRSFEYEQAEKVSGRVDALVSRIEDLSRVGVGKRGKIRPTYQRAIDEARTELADIVETHPEHREKAKQALGDFVKPVEETPTEGVAEPAPTEAPLAEGRVVIAPRGKGGRAAFVDVSGPVGVTARFLKRNFTSAGDLPKPVFNAKIAKESWFNERMQRVAFTGKDYNRALRKEYGKRPKPETIRAIGKVLKGEAKPETIKPETRAVVARMRQEIDGLSRELINSGAIQGDLIPRIEENIGFYTTRAYRVHDDPKYAESVPKEVRNRAAAYIRKEYPDFSENEVQGMIDALLYEGKAAESPIAMLKGSKLGSKDLSILRKRKGIAPEIRALWGEHEDPLVNYVRSVQKTAALIENHKFLAKVRKAGLGNFFHETAKVIEGVSYKTRIAADASSVMHPLNGLYTTPEIKRAFEEAVTPEQMGDLFRAYMKLNSAVKFSKTVGSVMTHIRNLIGNTSFAMANGHWRVTKQGRAWRTVLTSLAKLNNKQYRDYYEKLIRIGVIHESAREGELRDVIKDASDLDIDEYALKTARNPGRLILKGVTQLYRAEDDVWKIYAYENELARYRKAKPDWSTEKLERTVAEIVRNTYPTYSLVPRGIKKLRRFPFVGTFVSFPAEVVRTAGNTLALTKKELADPDLRAIGAQRMAGIAMASSMTAIIAGVSRWIWGVGEDEDEDIRRFVPEWSKNSQLVYVGRGLNGNWRVIDLSYTDPYEYLKKPITALLRGDDPVNAVRDAVKAASEPFLSEELLYGAIMDLARNKKQTGGKIFNPSDTPQAQIQDMLSYAIKIGEPGTVTSARRIYKGITGQVTPYGRAYDPEIEALAAFTGHRIMDLDIEQSMSFGAGRFNRSLSDGTSILTRVASRRGEVSDDEIRDAYKSMDRARRRAFQDLNKDIEAAMRLGVERITVARILFAAGVSEENIAASMAGTYMPYTPTPQFLSRIERLAKVRGEDVGSTFNDRRRLVLRLTQEAIRDRSAGAQPDEEPRR